MFYAVQKTRPHHAIDKINATDRRVVMPKVHARQWPPTDQRLQQRIGFDADQRPYRTRSGQQRGPRHYRMPKLSAARREFERTTKVQIDSEAGPAEVVDFSKTDDEAASALEEEQK